jgi:Fur family transcriptional regulator, ferric uptake regulator
MRNKKSPAEILSAYGMRQTGCRCQILEQFIHHDFALSHNHIESHIDSKYDRVTIYRNLKNFLDKGLIHKVLDDEGGIKYALCNETCSEHGHHHNHVHFKCEKCGKTICIDNLKIPEVSLPSNFEARELNLLIQGTCDECN